MEFYLCPVERQILLPVLNCYRFPCLHPHRVQPHIITAFHCPAACTTRFSVCMWSCTDAEFAPLTASWVWGNYLCKLPMFLIARFFKPWLWQGRDRLVLQCKAVRCQHGNASLEFMWLQPKGWEKQWHPTNKMHGQRLRTQGSLPGMVWKRNSRGRQSSAYQHRYSDGFLDRCSSATRSAREKKWKRKNELSYTLLLEIVHRGNVERGSQKHPMQ